MIKEAVDVIEKIESETEGFKKRIRDIVLFSFSKRAHEFWEKVNDPYCY